MGFELFFGERLENIYLKIHGRSEERIVEFVVTFGVSG